MKTQSYLFWFVAAIALAATPSLRAEAPKPAPHKTYEVETVRDVAYYTGDDADETRHKLDLFVPKDLKNFPVLLFVHGGAWQHGDKSWLGVYASFGKYCARHGIAAVVANYRLSPVVSHPEHVKDVARAFAWTQRNIKQYGGSPDWLFVSGHSAGGHLVSLLATDEQYLKAEGLTLDAIKGVIPMSGVYRIPDTSPFFGLAFGNDSATRKEASPLSHAHPGVPPFLLLYAENDLPYCGKQPSEEFCKALEEKKCQARVLEAKGRNHSSLILKVSQEDDPSAQAVLEFIHGICTSSGYFPFDSDTGSEAEPYGLPAFTVAMGTSLR